MLGDTGSAGAGGAKAVPVFEAGQQVACPRCLRQMKAPALCHALQCATAHCRHVFKPLEVVVAEEGAEEARGQEAAAEEAGGQEATPEDAGGQEEAAEEARGQTKAQKKRAKRLRQRQRKAAEGVAVAASAKDATDSSTSTVPARGPAAVATECSPRAAPTVRLAPCPRCIHSLPSDDAHRHAVAADTLLRPHSHCVSTVT